MRYLVATAVLAGLNLAMWALFFLPAGFPVQPVPQILAGLGILASLVMLALLSAAAKGEEASGPSMKREAAAVIAVAAALLIFGVVFDEVDPLPAALVLICGTAALLIGLSAAEALKEKGAFEITSHWGGLGGAVGGFRVSSAVTAVVLALVFLGAAVGVAGLGGDDGTTNNSVVPPPLVKPSDTDAGRTADSNTVDANAAAANTQAPINNATAENVSTNAGVPKGVGEAPSRLKPDVPDDQ